jgi:tubulysin polyketide synthase-like protein
MSAAQVLEQARVAGVSLWADGDTLRYRGPGEVLAKLLPTLKSHKPAILAALAHPDSLALWRRVAILDPEGRTVEVDTPSGWTLADWQAYGALPRSWVRRHGGPTASQQQAPANLDEALAAACEGVAGITPAQFRALLSPEDPDDIEAGAIDRKTRLGQDVELRRSASGKGWTRLSVGVVEGDELT